MMKGDASLLAPTPSLAQRSPWRSPVPYLFGGLAAMLGLIAFALLILACSYWKLSGHLNADEDNNNSSTERDVELGEADADDEKRKLPPAVFEEKILVIMAGQVKPTFLATPVSSRNSSIGSAGSGHQKADMLDGGSESSDRTDEKRKEGSGDQVQVGNAGSNP